MTLAIDKESPPFVLDDAGAVRVGDSRVTIDVVVAAFNLGHSAEAITENYPTLTLADVYATIAYYLRHRDPVDRYVDARRARAGQLRGEIESEPRNRALRERLIARRREQGPRP